LKGSIFHEIEKAVVTIEILKKDVKDILAWSGRTKTLNNGSITLTETFVYVSQSLKTRLQKKPKTSLKTQKQIKTIFAQF